MSRGAQRISVDLADTARRLARQRTLWQGLVDFDPITRYYARLLADHDHEAWLLTWLPGQGTPWHDHGGSAGSFVVLQGVLTEEVAGYRTAVDLDNVRRVTGPGVCSARRPAHVRHPPPAPGDERRLRPGGQPARVRPQADLHDELPQPSTACWRSRSRPRSGSTGDASAPAPSTRCSPRRVAASPA